MEHRGSKLVGAETARSAPVAAEKKTAPLIERFDALWGQTRAAFAQERTWSRARELALSALVCLGRRTITGLLSAGGQQFVDWSAAYRLFERERFATEPLFAPARRAVCETLQPQQPLVAMLDDTGMKKTGRKVHGAAWRRETRRIPLSPVHPWRHR